MVFRIVIPLETRRTPAVFSDWAKADTALTYDPYEKPKEKKPIKPATPRTNR